MESVMGERKRESSLQNQAWKVSLEFKVRDLGPAHIARNTLWQLKEQEKLIAMLASDGHWD